MEATIQTIKSQTMEHSPAGRVILMALMWALNVGVWLHNFAGWVKVLYLVLAGFATMLGLINQWNTFYKTYKTVWVVFKLNSFVTTHIIAKVKRKRKRKPHFTEKPPIL